MDKYLVRKPITNRPSINNGVEATKEQSSFKKLRIEVKLDDLPSDPGLRKKISDNHTNDKDNIRIASLQKGPCQPEDHDFPQRIISGTLRKFLPAWFKQYSNGNWLEYSIAKDAVFYLYCYLYRLKIGEQTSSDSFIIRGFTNWKKKEGFQVHVGNRNSAHNEARRKCQNLMNQKQHISDAFETQSNQARRDYRIRLTTSVDYIRYLLRQGLAFRGNDESEDSENQGNFLELLRFLANHNEIVKNVVLENTHGNAKLVAPDIQRDIVHATAVEITNVIINDLKGDLFSILIDKSHDISMKEKMAVVLRYVDAKGCVIECFLEIVHVKSTTALSLKSSIDALFSKYGLSLSSLRGQAYDGASNMQGEFNGLKTLIMKENPSAYYVHCFAHQLQLALIFVVRNHAQISLLFNIVSSLSNIVGTSCKRRDLLREKQYSKVIEALHCDKIKSGKGLNQETSLKRAGDTR